MALSSALLASLTPAQIKAASSQQLNSYRSALVRHYGRRGWTPRHADVLQAVDAEEANRESQPAARLGGHLQTIPTDLLLLAAKGELDLVALAKAQMANRGLGLQGEWVGFDAAAQVWGVK